MKVEWDIFKEFVDSRNISIQWIDMGKEYWLVGMDGPFSLECFLPKTVATEFEEGYKDAGNKSPRAEVVTQFEKDDKRLKLACGKAECDENGLATLEVKIPGVLAEGGGRYIDGGRVWFDMPHKDDRVLAVEIVDLDNVFGYGAGVVLKTWHDDSIDEANRGWYIPRIESGLSVDSIGGYGFLPAELYLRVIAQKGESQTSGTLYVNLKWGEEADS